MRRFVVVMLVGLALVSACARRDSDATGDLDGGTPAKLAAALREFRGKPVVVNYWATWCGPCKEEMPRIVAAANRYEGKVHFLGVNVEDDPSAAAAFIKEYKMNFRNLSDPKGEIRRKGSILGLPVTQFFDKDGELKFSHQGEIKKADLEKRIEETLRV